MKPEDRVAVVDKLLKGHLEVADFHLLHYGLVIYEAPMQTWPSLSLWPFLRLDIFMETDVHAVHDEGHHKGARNGKGAEIPRNSRGVAF